MSDTRALVDTILSLFKRRGDSGYGKECVSQREHALQCAALAQAEGADDTLVAAALLHDIGHLLHDLDDDAPERSVDDFHERLGAKWLTDRAPAAVVGPVLLHVAAKRYLCAVDSAYYDILSNASRVSLRLQGGPMSQQEVKYFESRQYWREAVRLRRWDDEAKVAGKSTPSLEDLRGPLEGALSSGS